ncbi:hypothetical protein JF729_14670 [Mycobacterium intracellulare]|uniref:hypothetical protein n=1 Tax=Mycobacterium intracellulare TaxID=1767 RepID=UPI001CDA214E|nr:hypothetical protein [Mycobacterium intracellulare]MCA2249026.1 hypothetical protein [Mycobacterium intracellulare]
MAENSYAHARVLQTRQLRYARQLVEVGCPHCKATHWLLDPGQLVECLNYPGRTAWLDGLGALA